MGPTPVYGARAEKFLQNADFAMKQTNICRLSGDITTKLLLTETVGELGDDQRPCVSWPAGISDVAQHSLTYAAAVSAQNHQHHKQRWTPQKQYSRPTTQQRHTRPRCRSLHTKYGVSKKKSPRRLVAIFPTSLGVFQPNFIRLLCGHIYATLRIFIQLSATLTKLCHIKCDHPACVSVDGGHFEHIMVVALIMA